MGSFYNNEYVCVYIADLKIRIVDVVIAHTY